MFMKREGKGSSGEGEEEGGREGGRGKEEVYSVYVKHTYVNINLAATR